MRPTSTVGDMVVFPACYCGPKVYPIAFGAPTSLETGIPIAYIGSPIAGPTMPIVITGTGLHLKSGIPISRIGDAAVCGACGAGFIISGKPTRLET